MATEKDQDLFIDAVTNMSYNGGAFRFDMMSIDTAHKDEKGNPTLKRQAHVVMTPQGFMQTAMVMQNFIKQVEEKGLIRRAEVAKAADSADKEEK